MPIDVVAIVTPTKGKEARLKELIVDFATWVQQHEGEVSRYEVYEQIGEHAGVEFVFVERYVASHHMILQLRKSPSMTSPTGSSSEHANEKRVFRYKDAAAHESHMGMEIHQALVKAIEKEELLAAPLKVMKLKPLIGGFNTR